MDWTRMAVRGPTPGAMRALAPGMMMPGAGAPGTFPTDPAAAHRAMQAWKAYARNNPGQQMPGLPGSMPQPYPVPGGPMPMMPPEAMPAGPVTPQDVLNVALFEYVPYVMPSRNSASIAASGSADFPAADLINGSGFDFLIEEVAINIDAQATAGASLTNLSLRIFDVTRNTLWTANNIRCSLLVEQQGNTVVSNKWHLCKPYRLLAGGSLKVTAFNNDSSEHTYDISFNGSLLVPIFPGSRFSTAVAAYQRAIP